MIKKNHTFIAPPPPQTLPIMVKSIAAYKLWHEFLPHFPKTSRYTLGNKIDAFFVEVVEVLFTASHANRKEKLPYLQMATAKLDLLKFFLQIAWEIKALDNKKYLVLSENLNEIGKMLGGWHRHLMQNPA